MNTTWYERGMKTGFEKGVEQGFEKGVERARREALRELLEERFGSLAPAIVERLKLLPLERVIALSRMTVRAQSFHELGLED